MRACSTSSSLAAGLSARCALVAVLAAAFLAGLAGCGDDDGDALETEGPRTRVPIDAGPLDAGPALDELGLPGDKLVSSLSGPETQRFCMKLDEVTELLGDVERACAVEAYLITYDTADCESVVSQCTKNNATVLGLELELPCSLEQVALDGCDAPLGDVLACAGQLGDFWSKRTCDVEALAEVGPACPDALAGSCPQLFGQ